MRTVLRVRPGPLSLGILLWLACELVVFVLVVQRIGFAGAVVIGLATTFLGGTMLRHLGIGAVRGLRRGFQGAEPAPGAMLDGSLRAIGAILLLLPGFLSDLVGLALAAPSVRQWLAARFGAVAAPGQQSVRARPGTIDLGPAEWQRVDGVENRRGNGRPAGSP